MKWERIDTIGTIIVVLILLGTYWTLTLNKDKQKANIITEPSLIKLHILTVANESVIINHEYISEELIDDGWNVTLTYGGIAETNLHFNYGHIWYWHILNNSRNFSLSYDYYYYRDELNHHFEIIFHHTKWIVNLFNLTIDWSEAQWYVMNVDNPGYSESYEGYPPVKIP